MKIKWGIIGCGDVAEHKGGPAIEQAGNSELVAVMRRDVAKARDFARRHKAKSYYHRAEELVKDQEINAVYVATPPDTHSQYTIMAANAGKHILCEKPMALNITQCKEMMIACQKNRVHLMIAYYRRCYPQIRKIKSLLNRGDLGRIIQAKIHLAASFPNKLPGGDRVWRAILAKSGGGLLVDIGSHRIDALIYLLGKVKGIAALVNRHTPGALVEDSVQAILKFRNGVLANLMIDSASRYSADSFEIYGTKGYAIASPLGKFRLRVCIDKNERAYSFKPLLPTHILLVRHFLRVINGKESSISSGEDGIRTTEVIEAIYRSAKQKRFVECSY